MAVQWVVKKIKWGGLVSWVSISGWWVSVRQNTLRLGERRPSTQLLKTIQTDGKTHTDKIQTENTHRQKYRGKTHTDKIQTKNTQTKIEYRQAE